MRVQTASFATLGLALVALLCACARQGQGEPCNTQGNDCQSSLTCVPIPGSTDLGTCCKPNTQCSNAQSGFPLDQDGNTGGPDAATESSDATNESSDAPTESSDATNESSDAPTESSDAPSDTTTTDSPADAGDADTRQGADASADAGGGG
jgi:hypothetical protein